MPLNPSRTIRALRPYFASRPALARQLRKADAAAGRAKHSLAARVPAVIRPQPRQLTIAITAACNLKCVGCGYGRDFMVGSRLPTELLLKAIDDAHAAGIDKVRLYGGEPLLHPGVVEAVQHITDLGMEPYLTTNALLLGKKIEPLYEAGLRWSSIGFYGKGGAADAYTQTDGYAEGLEESLTQVREHCGADFDLQLNYVLVRPTTNIPALHEAWELARRFDMHLHLDLYGYSIPFFEVGAERGLGYTEADRPEVEAVAEELVRLKREHPDRIPHHEAFLRSVPDWLILEERMRVPCDAYELIWIGADGSVQLCDTAFPLGNLHETRLKDLLYTDEHKDACRKGFALDCPNCTCKADSRIRRDAASMRRYRG